MIHSTIFVSRWYDLHKGRYCVIAEWWISLLARNHKEEWHNAPQDSWECNLKIAVISALLVVYFRSHIRLTIGKNSSQRTNFATWVLENGLPWHKTNRLNSKRCQNQSGVTIYTANGSDYLGQSWQTIRFTEWFQVQLKSDYIFTRQRYCGNSPRTRSLWLVYGRKSNKVKWDVYRKIMKQNKYEVSDR